jgi:hypothetical protein
MYQDYAIISMLEDYISQSEMAKRWELINTTCWWGGNIIYLHPINSGPSRRVLWHCPKSLSDEGGYHFVNIVNRIGAIPVWRRTLQWGWAVTRSAMSTPQLLIWATKWSNSENDHYYALFLSKINLSTVNGSKIPFLMGDLFYSYER